ncbi:MAG: triose-phosphate isomerase [Alphaproteobacteria bacterium]
MTQTQAQDQSMTKKLIAGNWKMNGDLAGAKALCSGIVNAINDNRALLQRNDFLICPPHVHLYPLAQDLERLQGLGASAMVKLGGQDCSANENGAYTGDISAQMLQCIGCGTVILGHSERRQYHFETNALVRRKAVLVQKTGMCALICVGETETQRDSGQALSVVIDQIRESVPEEQSNAANLVIAYEPVWAIGTGKVAEPQDIFEMHGAIRDCLKEMLAQGANIRILYGGSVKPENASEILHIDHVNGALIGGASLKVESFLGIAEAV